MADAMVGAEARHIAQRATRKWNMRLPGRNVSASALTDRRKFLFAAGSVAGVAGSSSIGAGG